MNRTYFWENLVLSMGSKLRRLQLSSTGQGLLWSQQKPGAVAAAEQPGRSQGWETVETVETIDSLNIPNWQTV